MKTILFVCVHNAGRSQMAEALTNRQAQALGLDVRALSAGTVGGKSLNPIAVEVMEEIGVSMAGQEPKLLTQQMADQADLIISMGCGVDAQSCPARFLLTEDWELDDPAAQSIEQVREIRDEIGQRVDQLLSRLTSNR